ncbi:MAG: hypothetical protein QW416_00745 [Candidatus Nitrosocaldaceae archaeon]
MTLIMMSVASVGGSLIYDSMMEKLSLLNKFNQDKLNELVEHINNDPYNNTLSEDREYSGMIVSNGEDNILLIVINNNSNKLIDDIIISLEGREVEFNNLMVEPDDTYTITLKSRIIVDSVDARMRFDDGETKTILIPIEKVL